jgi:phosphohistidine swiveling domain-containing protein
MNKKEQNKKIKWVKIVTRAATPQIMTILLAPATVFFKKLGVGFRNHLYVPENGKHAFYFDGEEVPNTMNTIINNAKKVGYVEEQIDICAKDGESLLKSSRVMSENAKKKPSEELIRFYLDYLKKFEEFYVHMWTSHPIEEYLEETVKSEIGKELNKRNKSEFFDEYLKAITGKVKLVRAEEEQVGLFEIASKIKENNGEISKEIDELIEGHVEKYCWLPFYSLDLKLWNKEHFLNALKEIKNPKQELKKVDDDLNEKKEKLNKIKEKLKDNNGLIRLIDILQEYLFFRTERADMMRRAYYYARPFFMEIAKRMNWHYDEVVYTTPEELVDFLKDGRLPNLNEIKERQKQFLIIRKDEDTKLVSRKEEIEEIVKNELGGEALKVTVLQGSTAFPGIVKGRVKKIENIKEMGKIEKGDILVASMTTPDMIIAIRKAAAIVTDEGGITCHAAIVSRELKIPCVIATKVATKVLKDGDLVEVDAEKGIIKIIEKI